MTKSVVQSLHLFNFYEGFLQYGDSPTCLDKNTGNVYEGVTAKVQGYGETEDGTSGTLLETEVTVISNEECMEMLNHNTTLAESVRTQVTEQLPYGLNYGLFWSVIFFKV